MLNVVPSRGVRTEESKGTTSLTSLLDKYSLSMIQDYSATYHNKEREEDGHHEQWLLQHEQGGEAVVEREVLDVSGGKASGAGRYHHATYGVQVRGKQGVLLAGHWIRCAGGGVGSGRMLVGATRAVSSAKSN